MTTTESIPAPGPWRVGDDITPVGASLPLTRILDDEDVSVGYVYPWPEAPANAALIAAAPDLLAACEGLWAALGDVAIAHRPTAEAVAKVGRAIALARGGR